MLVARRSRIRRREYDSFMKKIVATHEAGHALAILVSPIREHILSAKIFEVGGEWFGEVRLDQCDRRIEDSHCVSEFAKDIAGPVVQNLYFPGSSGPAIQKLIESEKGVLAAIGKAYRGKLPIKINWIKDMSNWIRVAGANNIRGFDSKYLEVEQSLNAFSGDPDVVAIINSMAALLVTRPELNRKQLLDIPIEHLPKLNLPPDLNFFSAVRSPVEN